MEKFSYEEGLADARKMTKQGLNKNYKYVTCATNNLQTLYILRFTIDEFEEYQKTKVGSR